MGNGKVMRKEKRPGPQIVQGSIWMDQETPLFKGTIYLRIIDVSRADALSQSVAEEVLRDILLGGAHTHSIRFSIKFDPEKGKRYDLFVHIDVDGDCRISQGDYISAVSYPINPWESSSPLEIRVIKLG
jgi:uncharacterized lipoprotein YbaY